MPWSLKRWASCPVKGRQPFQHYTGDVFLSSNIALFQIKWDIIISLCDLSSDILCHKLLPCGRKSLILICFSLLQIMLTNLTSALSVSAQSFWKIKTRLATWSQEDRHRACQRSLGFHAKRQFNRFTANCCKMQQSREWIWGAHLTRIRGNILPYILHWP